MFEEDGHLVDASLPIVDQELLCLYLAPAGTPEEAALNARQTGVDTKPKIYPVPLPISKWPEVTSLRLGYVDLTVESDQIIVSRSQNIDEKPLLRSRGSIKKGAGAI